MTAMRFLLLLFVLIPILARAQEQVDTHGKTEAQILEMGMDGWMNFYTANVGSSTADMCEAAGVYGAIAEKRNNGLLKAAPTKRKAQILKLRKLLGQFDSSAVDVGYCESGGGTMFNPMWASVSGEVEDALYPMLGGKAPKSKPMVVSAVTRQLARISKDIEDMHTPDNEFMKYKEAKSALADMRAAFGGIVAIAKSMSRVDSDRLLSFCLDRAKSATDFGK